MKIIIHKSSRIGDIEEEFNRQYPNLKIEFYENERKRSLSGDDFIGRGVRLGSIPNRPIQSLDGFEMLEIEDSMTVKEMETILLNQFGLYARVFRRFGQTWLPTVLTSEWTLRRQDEQGRIIKPVSS